MRSQDRRVLQELGLCLWQSGEELEAEVLGHEAVVASEALDSRRVCRPRVHRQRREVQAGRPALCSLGQLGELARVELDASTPPAATLPPARPAEDPRRRSPAPFLAPASAQAAVPALLDSRPRSVSRPGRTRKAPRARPDTTGWRQHADRQAPARAVAPFAPVRSQAAVRVSTRWIPLGRTTRRTRRVGPARPGEWLPRRTA